MTTPVSPKFQTLLTQALSDQRIENKELTRLRDRALLEIKKAKSPMGLTRAYRDVFEDLRGKAADRKAVTFTKQVAKEFQQRAAHQKIVDALKAAGSKLPPSLAGIDLDRTFVGSSMDRAIYLDVSFEMGTWGRDPAKWTAERGSKLEALKKWIASQPALRGTKDLDIIIR